MAKTEATKQTTQTQTTTVKQEQPEPKKLDPAPRIVTDEQPQPEENRGGGLTPTGGPSFEGEVGKEPGFSTDTGRREREAREQGKDPGEITI